MSGDRAAGFEVGTVDVPGLGELKLIAVPCTCPPDAHTRDPDAMTVHVDAEPPDAA